MIKHYNINVIGKVQGVFYRTHTETEAKKLGLSGFVRNEINGNVYIEVEGEEDQLIAFVNWCKTGPAKAKVENVSFSESEFRNFSDFIIKR